MFRSKLYGLFFGAFALLILIGAVDGSVRVEEQMRRSMIEQNQNTNEEKLQEYSQRREKMERQLDDLQTKVVAYEDGRLDIPEATYIRYAQRVTMYLHKIELMKQKEEELVRNRTFSPDTQNGPVQY